MMWNHVAIAHAAWDCVRANYVPMGYIGYAMTALSLAYHRYYERCFAKLENFAAKCCIATVELLGLRAKLPVAHATLPSALVYALWKWSQRDYERWHPWMHFVVAADVQYFLHCVRKQRVAPRLPQVPG